MRFFILVVASIAALVLPAYGGTVTYNFNDNTLDGLLPQVVGGYGYSVSGGVLNVSETSPGSGEVFFGIPFNVTGDFTATVDISRSISQNSTGLLGFEAYDPSTFSWFADAYLISSSGLQSVIQPTSAFNSTGTSSTTVSLKIARTGSAFAVSYSLDGGTTYSLFNSSSTPIFASPAGIGIFMENSTLAGDQGSFDNFTITSDSISAVPLPSAASAGLSLLAVMLGWKFVSRRLSQVA